MKQVKNKVTNLNASTEDQNVEVLYQKMGDRWYAFSQYGEEVFVGSLTEEELRLARESGLESWFVDAPQSHEKIA